MQRFRLNKFLAPLSGIGNAKSVLEVFKRFDFSFTVTFVVYAKDSTRGIFNYNPDIERTFHERRRAQGALFVQLPPFLENRSILENPPIMESQQPGQQPLLEEPPPHNEPPHDDHLLII